MYEEIEATENYYDMPQFVDTDDDNVFKGFGEGFEDEMVSSSGSVFMNSEDEAEHDVLKIMAGK